MGSDRPQRASGQDFEYGWRISWIGLRGNRNCLSGPLFSPTRLFFCVTFLLFEDPSYGLYNLENRIWKSLAARRGHHTKKCGAHSSTNTCTKEKRENIFRVTRTVVLERRETLSVMDFADNVKSGCRDFVKLVIILRYCPALQGRQMLDIDLCTGENGERRSVTHEFRVGHSIDKIKKPGRWIENKTIEKKRNVSRSSYFFFYNTISLFLFLSQVYFCLLAIGVSR